MPHPWIIADATLLRLMTARIVEYRIGRRARMAFEHKALKGNWATFRKNLDALNTALAKGNDTMPGVTNNVTGILGQVNAIVADVEFMGKMLGNGSGDGSDEAEKPKEPPPEKQAITESDVGKIDPAVFEIKPGTTPEQNMRMIEETRAQAPHRPNLSETASSANWSPPKS